MSAAEVITAGTDSSGRAILMTRRMSDWWEGVVSELGFRPVITQGAWMARVPGGGAENSKGYHDGGGCLDIRTRDLTRVQQLAWVRVCRERGAGAWRRFVFQGMDEDHGHLVLGSDFGLTDNAAQQWREYLAGGDGLAGSGSDYEWRPDPIVTEPPVEDDMPYTKEELVAIVQAGVRAELERPTETKRGLRSLRQQVKELFQR
jgi:hypothetical protein